MSAGRRMPVLVSVSEIAIVLVVVFVAPGSAAIGVDAGDSVVARRWRWPVVVAVTAVALELLHHEHHR